MHFLLRGRLRTIHSREFTIAILKLHTLNQLVYTLSFINRPASAEADVNKNRRYGVFKPVTGSLNMNVVKKWVFFGKLSIMGIQKISHLPLEPAGKITLFLINIRKAPDCLSGSSLKFAIILWFYYNISYSWNFPKITTNSAHFCRWNHSN